MNINETIGIIEEDEHHPLPDWASFLVKTGEAWANLVDDTTVKHTFAHLLINQLAFECGYAAASLRERLYISDEPEQRMSGVLIYTASGDAQGSLGGLVRMGEPSRIEPVIRAMLGKASWCGNDPICMEQGHPDMGGQGPDTANLAACYACALVPETSCEEFNRLLDRALLIGTPEDPALGYFHQLSV